MSSLENKYRCRFNEIITQRTSSHVYKKYEIIIYRYFTELVIYIALLVPHSNILNSQSHLIIIMFNPMIKLKQSETLKRKRPVKAGNIINATPHSIHLYSKDKKKMLMVLESEGFYIRMKSEPQIFLYTIDIDDISMDVNSEQDFTGLMDQSGKDLDVKQLFDGEKLENMYIVAWPVLEYVKKNYSMYSDRFFTPDSGPQGGVRDSGGRIIGTINLIQ